MPTQCAWHKRPFGCRCHVCAFFHSSADECDVMLAFMKEAFDAGDRAVHIIDKHQRPEWLRRLADTGIDTSIDKESGQLEVRAWEDAYLRGGRFDQHAVVVMDIMPTHPQVIVGGILQENPFYAPPDEFLRELSSREARPLLIRGKPMPTEVRPHALDRRAF